MKKDAIRSLVIVTAILAAGMNLRTVAAKTSLPPAEIDAIDLIDTASSCEKELSAVTLSPDSSTIKYFYPDWSANGKKLLFEARHYTADGSAQSGNEIRLYTFSDCKSTVILAKSDASQFSYGKFHFSPASSTHFAYEKVYPTESIDGKSVKKVEIFLFNLSDSSKTKLNTVSYYVDATNPKDYNPPSRGSTSLRWAPNGLRLYFIARVNNNGSLGEPTIRAFEFDSSDLSTTPETKYVGPALENTGSYYFDNDMATYFGITGVCGDEEIHSNAICKILSGSPNTLLSSGTDASKPYIEDLSRDASTTNGWLIYNDRSTTITVPSTEKPFKETVYKETLHLIPSDERANATNHVTIAGGSEATVPYGTSAYEAKFTYASKTATDAAGVFYLQCQLPNLETSEESVSCASKGEGFQIYYLPLSGTAQVVHDSSAYASNLAATSGRIAFAVNSQVVYKNMDLDDDGIADPLDSCPTETGENCDTDGDGSKDKDDNCPSDANADQRNSDTDGQGDVCDDNDDNDNFDDADDNCPTVSNNDQADVAPKDGVGDACVDSDGDGVPDVQDVCANGDDSVDSDLDTRPDACDNCPSTENSDQANIDGDASGDVCDDGDGDGVLDTTDNCPYDSNSDQKNNQPFCGDDNADGVIDSSDHLYSTGTTAADGTTTMVDSGEACPYSTAMCGDVNASSTIDNGETACSSDTLSTTSGGKLFIAPPATDAFGNACDVDSDGKHDSDQANWKIDEKDNCPMEYNPDQADSNTFEDGDGKGDACENVSCDASGTCQDSNCDQDKDSYIDNSGTNATEYCSTMVTTYPGIIDNCPTVANASQDDTDKDGAGNACDEDDDADGVADDADNCDVEANADQADLDSDDQGDGCDNDRDGDGITNNEDDCPDELATKDEVDDLGCIPETDKPDRDGDGVPDEDDVCPDDAENSCEDSDGDGVNDDVDACPTDASNTCTGGGGGGGGSSNGDGQINCALNTAASLAITPAPTALVFLGMALLPLLWRRKLNA